MLCTRVIAPLFPQVVLGNTELKGERVGGVAGLADWIKTLLHSLSVTLLFMEYNNKNSNCGRNIISN